MDAYIVGENPRDVYRLTDEPEVIEDILLDADGTTILDSKLSDPLTYGPTLKLRAYDVYVYPIERYWIGTEEFFPERTKVTRNSYDPWPYVRDITGEELACVKMLDSVGFIDSVTYKGRTIERMSKNA